MRTETELLAAFDVIADEAEFHLSSPAPEHGGGHRRRAALFAAAAAIVVLGAGGLWIRAELAPSRSPAAGGGDASAFPVQTSLFTFATSPRLVVGDIDLAEDMQTWSVHVDGVQFSVALDTKAHADSTGYAYPNTDPATATKVDLNGVTGYLGCSGHSSDPPGCSPDDLTLAWQFDGASWAQVFGTNQPGNADRMLWLARAMDFTHTHAIRTPISVPSPDGQHLVEFGLGKAKGGKFVASATYATSDPAPSAASTTDGVGITVGPDVHKGDRWQPRIVDSHQAWWDPGTATADPARFLLDLGNGYTVLVMDHAKTARSLASFEQIAESVRLAPNLNDPRSWPTVAKALH